MTSVAAAHSVSAKYNTPTQKALLELLEDKGPAILSGLSVDDDDGSGTLTKKLKVGTEMLTVTVTIANGGGNEKLDFQDRFGKHVATARIDTKSDAGVRMFLHGDLVGKEPAVEAIDAKFKKALIAEVDALNGTDPGHDVKTSTLPAPVRARMEQIERWIGDSNGAKKWSFQGKTIYVLCDYSCVSTIQYVTEAGTRLHEVVG